MVLATIVYYLINRARFKVQKSKVKRLKRNCYTFALTVLQLCYAPVSYKIFQTFMCEDFPDGSAFLTFRSIADFSVEQAIEVRFQGKAIDRLNELEWIDGKIWANIWMTPFIVVVDPATGNVTSVIDCRNLVEDARASSPDIDVLNGIAWDATNRELYLTGKLWPWIYKVALDKKTSP